MTEDIIRSHALIDMQADVSALLISSLGSKMRAGYLNTIVPICPPGCAYYRIMRECGKQHQAVEHKQGVGTLHARAHRRRRTKSGVHCFPAEKKALKKNQGGSTRKARVWRQRSRSGGSSRVKDGK